MTAEHLGHSEDEVGRGCAFWQGTGHAHADHVRRDQGKRLAEHRGLRFDAANAPAQDA